MPSDIIFYIPWILIYTILVSYVSILLKHRKDDLAFKHKEAENIKILKERERAFNATSALNAIVLQTLDYDLAVKQIADALPQFLGYETGVLALVDKKEGVLKRVGLSNTSGSAAAIKVLEIPFSSIRIKLTDIENLCIQALNQNRSLHTESLYDVLRPVVSKENSDKIQKEMDTKTTLIFPLYSKENKPLGTLLISMKKEYVNISEYEHQTIRNFVDGIKIALGNATLYTSLARVSRELQEANQKLIGLDKLKDEFVSLASHELRTPMTSVKSYLWMTLKGEAGSLNEKQRLYVERAYVSVERLIKLVNDMLNISRIESGRITIELSKVDLNQLAQDVIDQIMPRAEELGISILIESKLNQSFVLADADKIKEVLFNLIGNSIKFTQKGGKIKITFSENDGYIETKVEDNGAGISAENIAKLFKKFNMLPESYSKNKNASGSGLGLYISRSIIELHGGNMWVTSEGQGKGAEFYFTLKMFSVKDSVNIKAERDEDNKKLGIVHTEI